jgi:hypothetical protein
MQVNYLYLQGHIFTLQWRNAFVHSFMYLLIGSLTRLSGSDHIWANDLKMHTRLIHIAFQEAEGE